MTSQKAKSNLRLAAILMFLLFQVPGQYRQFFLRKSRVEVNSEQTLLFTLLFCLFLFLEILEYKKWNYRCANKRIIQGLFLVRLVTVTAILCSGIIKVGNPGMSLYLALLLFYGYFALSFKMSFALMIASLLSVFVYEFLRMRQMAAPQVYYLFFLIYKLMTMMVFYLFALLWEKDRIAGDDNIRLLAELNQSEQQLRQYAQKIAEHTALEERTRLARDIHDSVGHALTGIQIQLSKADAYLERDPCEAGKAVREAKDAALAAMEDIRSSLGVLNNKESGIHFNTFIEPVLKSLETSGIYVKTRIQGEEEGYNYAVLITLFRVLQEGTTNILKHAEADRVELDVLFSEDAVKMTLEDNGKGFDSSRITKQDLPGHFGLKGLEQRVELVRGELFIESSPKKGCILKTVLPKDPVSLIGGSDV
ncbi:MAG: sensor histidine kinase [Spirochaetales bacterium]|nr:sensor histidine kinase [Spirochaetales bacterium]